jgi:hypothetical protein
VSILNADLHCHSVVSDGTLTPEALALRAHANGVQLWALTDHDEIGGQQRAATAAKEVGMQYLSGTEISVSFAGHTVHIVGLGFDIHDPRVVEGLQSTRGGRHARAQDMAAGLAKVGIESIKATVTTHITGANVGPRTFTFNNPIFADDHVQMVTFGLKAGIVDGKYALETLPFPNKDMALQALKEKEAKHEQMMAELMQRDPEALAKILQGGGKGKGKAAA